jgi:peptide/nickel transport system substrate-binding protein
MSTNERTGTSYWERATSRRLSRRTVLQASAAGGVAMALAAAGCGDDASTGSSNLGIQTRPSGGAVASATTDVLANVTRGGTFATSITSDPPTLDPYVNPATNTKLFAAHVYSRLYKYKTGPGLAAADASVVGDLAAGAEASADGLQWVVKLRPNATFHNVDPVNGRKVTTEDVKFSWERASGPKGINRTSLEFVTNIQFPDAETIKFTLKEPNAAFLDVLADMNLLWIQPTEADGKFNTATTAIGSGPWLFDHYTVSQEIAFKRNPNWYESGFPLLDSAKVIIIPAYPNILAQFQAGGIDLFSPNAEDLITLRKQSADTQLLSDIGVSSYQLYFDKKTPNAPWQDERVRLAMSMALDRNGLFDLAYNVSKLKDAGLDVPVHFNNIIPVGFPKAWLDPVGAEAGDAAKSFTYNLAEAKKLLSAASYPNGFSATFQYTGNGYGALHNTIAESTQAMLTQLGITTTIDVQDYNSKYYTQTYRGNFSGIAFGPESSFNDAGSYPLRLFTANALNKGTDSDQKLSDMAFAQQREMDPEKRRQLLHDIQKYHATKMYVVPSALGGGPTWTAVRPNVRNADNFRARVSYGYGAEATPYYWKA